MVRRCLWVNKVLVVENATGGGSGGYSPTTVYQATSAGGTTLAPVDSSLASQMPAPDSIAVGGNECVYAGEIGIGVAVSHTSLTGGTC